MKLTQQQCVDLSQLAHKEFQRDLGSHVAPYTKPSPWEDLSYEEKLCWQRAVAAVIANLPPYVTPVK
jgi:hypothetical protein